MKYLIFAVILYFILQAAGNLVYILRGDGGAAQPEMETPPPSQEWKGPSPRGEMEGLSDHPTFWGEDVEDATWREVDE
ncbi:MAG: hypothetical protein BRD35_08585 [Bacteroidetes bacterium QH_7_62_13]|nr:MAG: hypothetical protein BRD35_08585 [Bacteroidetes bacterium QH_7_62_13]